jgi:uncharacterized protein involved in exopolysaccharide biosynthesis
MGRAWDLVRARWRIGVIVFTVIMTLVVFVVFTARSIYRAEARLRLGEPPPSGGVNPNAGIFGLLRLGGDAFANDLELLASRTVAEHVVEDQDLHVNVTAPNEWYRDSLFLSLEAGRSTSEASYRVRWDGRDSVDIVMMAPRRDSVRIRGPAGRPISWGGVTATFVPGRENMPEIEMHTVPFDLAVQQQRSRYIVERTRRDANMIEIRADYPDPGLARGVVDAVVRHFLALRATLQRRESEETVDSLRAEARMTLAELGRAEEALADWQRQERLIQPEAQGEVLAERYGQIVADLAQMESQLEVVDTLLARAGRASVPNARADLLVSATLLENLTIGTLLNQLVNLELQRAELATRRTAQNRDMQVMTERIAQLDSTLEGVAKSHREGLVQGIEGLRRELREADGVLARLPRAAVELARRERDVRMLTEIYVVTETRLRQEELREALTYSNVQVVDPPALRYKPVWPRKKLGLAIGFVLSSVFAVLGMAVHERADRSVRYASEVRTDAGVPVLLALPRDRRGGIRIGQEDVEYLRGRVNADRVTLVSADADQLAHDATDALGVFSRNGDPSRPKIFSGPAVRSLPTAGAIASRGGAILLVVQWGRTARSDIERAAEFLNQSGGNVAGAILVYPGARGPDDVWS